MCDLMDRLWNVFPAGGMGECHFLSLAVERSTVVEMTGACFGMKPAGSPLNRVSFQPIF